MPMRTSLTEGVCLGHGSASVFARQCWLESWPPIALGAAAQRVPAAGRASCGGESWLMHGDKQPETHWNCCSALPEPDSRPGT